MRLPPAAFTLAILRRSAVIWLGLRAGLDTILWQTAGTTHELGSPAEAERHDQFAREYLG